MQAEADRLKALVKADENKVKSLKNRLKEWFGFAGIRKTETPLHKFWIQSNGGARTWEPLRDPTEEDWQNADLARFVICTRTIVSKWNPNLQICDGGPFGAIDAADQIAYTWNSDEVLRKLLEIEFEADQQAEQAHKAQYSISLDEGLALPQCVHRADHVATLVRTAYVAENSLPFAKLNERGEHLRIK